MSLYTRAKLSDLAVRIDALLSEGSELLAVTAIPYAATFRELEVVMLWLSEMLASVHRMQEARSEREQAAIEAEIWQRIERLEAALPDELMHRRLNFG
jgi:hypothetical protein